MLFLGKFFLKHKLYTKFELASFNRCRNKQAVPNFLDTPLARTPANFGRKSCLSSSHCPSPRCVPNLKLLSLTVAEINSLLWISTVIEICACLPVGGATSSACRRQWLLGLQACARSLVFLLPRWFTRAWCTLVQQRVILSAGVRPSVCLSVRNGSGLWPHLLEFFKSNYMNE